MFPEGKPERGILNCIEHANEVPQKWPNNPYAVEHDPAVVDKQLDRLERIYAKARPEKWAQHLQEKEETKDATARALEAETRQKDAENQKLRDELLAKSL